MKNETVLPNEAPGIQSLPSVYVEFMFLTTDLITIHVFLLYSWIRY